MARKSHHRVEARIFDKRGRLLSTGQNSYTKTHPLMYKAAASLDMEYKPFLHAEAAALFKLTGTAKPHKIVVSRYNQLGQPRLAKPCPICIKLIREWNIKEIEWTI